MLSRGQDPKDMLIAHCDPDCKFFKEKLTRCENVLKNLTGADPEKSCMYRLRDYVTCIESCVI
jgi:ubiquinol-cytochrome c reductase subunit 6